LLHSIGSLGTDHGIPIAEVGRRGGTATGMGDTQRNLQSKGSGGVWHDWVDPTCADDDASNWEGRQDSATQYHTIRDDDNPTNCNRLQQVRTRMDPRTLQRVMDQRLAGALLAGLLMTLSSCAERAQYPPAVEVEASPGELAGPAPDWDNLVIEGVTTSPAEAPSLVIVDVIVPTTLGGLSRMVVTATEAAPPELRVLGLVYDDEKFGRYWILERVNEMTQEELESWLVCDA